MSHPTDIPTRPRPKVVPQGRHDDVNPVKALQGFGQSVWLDYLRRSLFTSGELNRLIAEDGLRGVISNPSIFEKAIRGSTDYARAIQEIDHRRRMEPMAVYEALAIRDIRDAAELLRPVYEATKHADGYVSLEVSPHTAHDTSATIEEARRLWRTVGRENVMIKVPASAEGLPAIRQLISEGININVTLLFSVRRYDEVARAYLDGLSALVQKGGDPRRVASVASFFISRIDTTIDETITKLLAATSSSRTRELLASLLGKVGIANAKVAYQHYQMVCRSAAWQLLAATGAHPQRLLWASTSTKDPRYRDVRYVEELIGRDTITTLTPATLDAFRDHGQPRASLETDIESARRVIQTLTYGDISLEQVTDRLLEDGITLFSKAFDSLLVAVDEGRQSTRVPVCHRQQHTVPHDDATKVINVIADWEKSAKARLVWSGNVTLWTGAGERDWLGWLTVTDDQLAHIGPLKQMAQDVAGTFSHVVLLGIGMASLCAEVMRRTFGTIKGFAELHVLDSIDPTQIKSIEGAVDLAHTLFIVSSKSGNTFETNLLLQYFMTRVNGTVGDQHAGGHFIAITGPDSTLHGVALRERFRYVYFGVSSIGGRYSTLSNFGMVPAAAMGVDVERLLDRADIMVHACAESVPTDQNPVIILGAILGTLAAEGRDKVTIITSPRLSGLGAWIEQLIAESSRTHGKGLIPVDREQVGPPGVYGQDRVFVYIQLESDPDRAHDSAVDTLERAGQPVVRIAIADTLDIGQEFFRWEIAIAVARSILGINPSKQPDVEAGKIATRRLTSALEKGGTLPDETPIFQEAGVALFTDAPNTAALEQLLDGDRSIAGYLRAHLSRIQDGDYFAILAHLSMSQAHEDALQKMRHVVRDRKRIATCLGFGPRFLHSPGHVYTDGPNTGVFLQITCDDAEDIPVPGQKFSFNQAKAAAALDDFTILLERGRRALRVHLDPDVGAGLAALHTAFERAIRGQARGH